jgi:hypothetical protein
MSEVPLKGLHSPSITLAPALLFASRVGSGTRGTVRRREGERGFLVSAHLADKNAPPLGPYSRSMARALWWS